eukprot:TRINITY_DN2665_c0_g1_i1.p1 TRINITY_DN2665_c0_g1~~TRINITY_DN2665_c0_g1_i1.p1  ORF type:complete len:217 (-),score=29.35 TRINITY_DN2665_c0_g1_i1:91-741(-)
MEEWQEWRTKRLRSLTNTTGWLTLCGLDWLDKEEGHQYTFGAGEGREIKFPEHNGNKVASGYLVVRDGNVTLHVTEGEVTVTSPSGETTKLKTSESAQLLDDADSKRSPSTVVSGSIMFTLIKRSGKLAVRSKDKESQNLKDFKGLDYFDYDPKWRLPAIWIAYDPPRELPITNVFDMHAPEKCPGAVGFDVNGTEYLLEVIEEEGEENLLFLIEW